VLSNLLDSKHQSEQPWPIIANFLSSLSTGWVGLDSGTGNGKYLPLPLDRPGDIWTIGLDRSKNLLQIARRAGVNTAVREVLVGDVLDIPWRLGVFVSFSTSHWHIGRLKKRRTMPYLLPLSTIFQLMSEGDQPSR